MDWNDELDEDLAQAFTEFLSELPELKEITLPRCFLPTKTSKITVVCGFAYASLQAFAAVIYVVATDEVTG